MKKNVYSSIRGYDIIPSSADISAMIEIKVMIRPLHRMWFSLESFTTSVFALMLYRQACSSADGGGGSKPKRRTNKRLYA